jgi:hypothetical protein
MSAPWFDPNLFGWLPGTVFGVLGGLWGSLGGVLAPQGRGRAWVVGLGGLLGLAAAVFLVAAVVAMLSGQPYGVWYSLGLPGLLGCCLMPGLLPVVIARYAQAEERRMAARDTRL